MTDKTNPHPTEGELKPCPMAVSWAPRVNTAFRKLDGLTSYAHADNRVKDERNMAVALTPLIEHLRAALPFAAGREAAATVADEYAARMISSALLGWSVTNARRDTAEKLAAAIRQLSAPVPEAGANEALVESIMRWGGRCRDCADCSVLGVCDNSGLPCEPDQRREAIRHVLKAAAYYGEHPEFLAPVPEAPHEIVGVLEAALDGLRYLLSEVQRRRPGTYRAGGTIADLEKALSALQAKADSKPNTPAPQRIEAYGRTYYRVDHEASLENAVSVVIGSNRFIREPSTPAAPPEALTSYIARVQHAVEAGTYLEPTLADADMLLDVAVALSTPAAPAIPPQIVEALVDRVLQITSEGITVRFNDCLFVRVDHMADAVRAALTSARSVDEGKSGEAGV